MVKTVLINPDERLRKISRDVTEEEFKAAKYQALVSDMRETMLVMGGIGLAAAQINEQIRIIIVNAKDGVMVFCNPEIISSSWKKEIEEEGCLSIPNVTGLVKRPYRVDIRAKKINGEEFKLTAKGIFARVIQHEVDHLNGVLFIDKAKKIIEQSNGTDERQN